MSLAPGNPKRPPADTVVMHHNFTAVESTIVDLAPDQVAQGPNVFIAGSTSTAAVAISQPPGTAGTYTSDDCMLHLYNIGYPGDRDVECNLTLGADSDQYDIWYIIDNNDPSDDGVGFCVRIQQRTDDTMRLRVRSALVADGTIANQTLDTAQAASVDTAIATLGMAARTEEFSLKITHRANKVTAYINDVEIDSYTYDATDLEVISGEKVHTDGSTGRVPVYVGFSPKDTGVKIDDFKVTIR
jgi:hypothetical protein